MSGAENGGRSILLVAYFYPPCPDAGAHRATAMAKYLRRAGHRVTVLTTSAYGAEPGEADVVRTADLQLTRARMRGHDRIQGMFESDTYSGRPHALSRVLVPEPLVVAWAPFALRAAKRLARERAIDCVITTSPPESVHLVGRALSRRGVPWLADIRDAWNFEPLRPRFPTAAQRRLDERLERRWLGSADAVTVVSRPAGEDLRRRLQIESRLGPNAWDPDLDDEVSSAAPSLDPARTSLVYTGRFGSYGRDPSGLVAAIRELASEEPRVAEHLELVVAGPVTDEERRLLGADLSPARISLLGSVSRASALELQRAADALLLLADSRPIVALAAGTEAGRIVLETGAGEVAPSNDVAAIRGALRKLAAGELRAPDPERVRTYTYPAAAGRMADAVEAAIRHAGEPT
jgi:glycosyltransferase involved in cell wall biosynthesis